MSTVYSLIFIKHPLLYTLSVLFYFLKFFFCFCFSYFLCQSSNQILGVYIVLYTLPLFLPLRPHLSQSISLALFSSSFDYLSVSLSLSCNSYNEFYLNLICQRSKQLSSLSLPTVQYRIINREHMQHVPCSLLQRT